MATGSNAQGGFRPGDVFREYKWRPEGKWQRVTGPDATHEGAQEFLPNAINTIAISRMEGATRIEAYIEMLLCHGGTANKRIRMNGNAWIPIPEPELIPGTSGTGGPDGDYQYMRYPCVDVPLQQVRQGENTFAFTCSSGTSLGKGWPQWILYGVTFRVYYESTRPYPAGEITHPSGGAMLGELPVFEAQASGVAGVRQVDFIGYYEDFNWEGDGDYTQWQFRYLYGEIRSHIGTATEAPYRVTWDNAWIPTQCKPIKVVARVVDTTGMCYVTPAVEGIRLARPYTVRLYRPYDVPRLWSTRAGKRHGCKVNVQDDLSRAVDAKVVMVTWNGVAAEEIGINDQKIVEGVGKNHDLGHDEFPVPVALIRPGVNTLYTFSTTEHHGIEVQWPGMVLMVRYEVAE